MSKGSIWGQDNKSKMKTENILEAQDIHTYYGDSYILQGLSLCVPRSNIVSLLGRNGVGKTTLIQSIMGLTPPRKGKITFKGYDITRLPPHKISRLGISIVPQGNKVFPSLTVRENLIVTARTGASSNWTNERIMEVFPALKARYSQVASTLSGGEQKMLRISCALVSNSDMLLLDEPTAALAPLIICHIAEILGDLKRDRLSILLAEQNLNFAVHLCDYIYVLARGIIAYEGFPEDFQENESVKRTYLSI